MRGYPKYVSVKEKKKRAEKFIKKLKKNNPNINPVIVKGRKIAKTWWGKSWNDNLEKYADYSNRISRGRSYLRHRAVLDLKIKKGNINALVLGSGSYPYEVFIKIEPLKEELWDNIINDFGNKIDSFQEILDGKFPKGLAELFTSKENGLFPSPKQIEFGCDCPDSARLCKHIAAVLLGVGARLDEKPELFFELRDIEIEELILTAIDDKTKKLLDKSDEKSGKIIDDEDISDLFDL